MRALTLGSLRASACFAAALGALAACLAWSSAVAAVTVAPGAPASCSGVQITDAPGDGHHRNTDITAAWLTQASGRLQAVIVTTDGFWKPAHDDSDAAGWAVLWQFDGATRYVRAVANQAGALTFDAGSWTRAGGFVSVGPIAGATSAVGADGWLSLDVPASLGGADGSRLGTPFALTYDGREGTDLHWVDRAPGGVTPEATEVGADVVVGPCPSPSSAAAPSPAATDAALTGVSLNAPAKVVGAQRALALRGSVTPARAGVGVTITTTTRAGTPRARSVSRTATTDASGMFTLRTSIQERTQVRATAGGLGSQTLAIDVQARVRISVRRTRAGGAVITGTVSPRLPGRVLWLREDAVTASATARPSAGRFVFRLAHPGRGRYQALFLPDHDRALRGLSNSGVIR